MARVTVSTDGFVGEDAAGWAFVATMEGETVTRHGELPARVASHIAEWTAVARALAWVERTLAPGDTFELRTDSALVAKGLASRRPQMSGEAAEIRAEARRTLARLAAHGIAAKIVRVPRAQNEAADAASRK